MELAKRLRYSPDSALYRSKTEKGLKFSLAEFTLLNHHVQNKLREMTCDQFGKRIHLAGECFVRTNPTEDGVEILKFFFNKSNVICPGNPKVPLNKEQWEKFKAACEDMHKQIPDVMSAAPCFTDADHFDADQEFIGCPVCLPFQK